MANRQLVDYVRAQTAQRASIDQIRTVLLQQGWTSQDVEAAIMESHQQNRNSTKQEHHTNFLVIAVSIIIIIGLIFGLLVVVFKKSTEPINSGDDETINEVKTLPPIEEKEDPTWFICAELVDYSTKHACYYDLNFADNRYDCDAIPSAEEKNACYRGKDQVLSKQYEQEDNTLVEVVIE